MEERKLLLLISRPPTNRANGYVFYIQSEYGLYRVLPLSQSSGNLKKSGKEQPISTVDLIVRKLGDQREILIETRGREPFTGYYCLPGGHVDYGETVESAALRELEEECAIQAELVGILGVYSDPKRDPRGQRISTAFIANYAGGELKAGDDAGSARWINLGELLDGREERKIAFDHRLILSHYESWLSGSNTSKTFWSTK